MRHGENEGGRHRDVGARLRRRSPWPWIAAGLGAVALAAGIATVVTLASSSPPAILVEDFDEDPAPSWTLSSPGGPTLTAGADGACTVAQDRALVVWRSVEGFPAELTLLDTASGTALWSLRLPAGLREAGCVMVAAERDRAILSLRDAEDQPSLVAVDLEKGVVAAEARDRTFLAAPEAADGDVVAMGEDAVERLSALDLRPVWGVEATGPSLAIGETVVVIGGEVHDLGDGATLSWNAAGAAFAAVEGAMLAVERDGVAAAILRVDERSGATRWRLDLPDGTAIPLPGSGLLLIPDAAAGRLSAVRVADGSTAWSIDGALHPVSELLTASGAAGIALLPLDEDPGLVAVVDLATGDEESVLRVSEDGEGWASVLALTPDAVALSSPDGALLTAVDPATGEPRWSVERPADAPGEFALLGGRFLILGPAIRGLAVE